MVTELSRRRPSRAHRVLGCIAAATLVTALAPVTAEAAPTAPRLELRVVDRELTVSRGEGMPAYLDLGLYVAALDAPLEIQVHRPSYTEPIQVDQVLRSDNGPSTTRRLPATTLAGWRGFLDFFEITIAKPTGEVVRTLTPRFCVDGYERQRVNDEGPVSPVYPYACYGNFFTKGTVWGIEEGWAVDAAGGKGGWRARLADGTYDVTASISDTYVELLGLDEAATTANLTLHVKTSQRCRDCPYPGGEGEGPHQWASAGSAVPDTTNPRTETLPDLVSLPAWGINLREGRRATRLGFGATIWTAGAQDLVVEGFRRSDEATMDAYQYFYEDGEPVGRAPVGDFAYDDQRRHNHWHFMQFARYSLLDSTQTEVLRSKKEAFCLMPTDSIDLLLPGAEWRPDNTDLNTACGGPDALWIREVLPLGWGDTYFQGIPGQSFDVTDLPNGTYYIAVEANPDGLLFEQRTDNNVELREIILRGRPGSRRVEVPPWNGIDTENGRYR
ncbi:MAG: lysyl oxidase family protein [Actinomycetota bacterium]|nr:lysyl oxidase family protein [Actinomycetota bacterium]